MTDRQTPKQELVETLAQVRAVLAQHSPPAVMLIQVEALVIHAQLLALRVGSQAKPRKEKSA